MPEKQRRAIDLHQRWEQAAVAPCLQYHCSSSAMRGCKIIVLVMILTAGSAVAAFAQNVQHGAEIARANCARCHSIAKSGPSPFAPAPPFRILHERYPVETLEEALGEGIFVGHPAMPEIQLDPDDIGDFIAFLRSLE